MARLAYEFYVNAQIDETLPLEEYEIFIKPGFASASWRFHDKKHQIVVGEDIFQNATLELSEELQAEYMKSFLRHEFAHSVWSDRDLKSIDATLRSHGFAFEVFNLFEDARIEEKMRKRERRAFNWTRYEALGAPTNAIESLFYVIQREHRRDELPNAKKGMDASQYDEFKAVYEFYKKILECETFRHTLRVVKQWYARFPLTPKYVESLKESGYFFVDEARFSCDGAKFDELIDGLENVLCLRGSEHSSEKRLLGAQSTSTTLLSRSPLAVAFDAKARDALLEKMKKLFYVDQRFQSTKIPSKRLNLKRLAQGSEKIFKKKSSPSLCKKKIVIVLDLSASMRVVIANMRLLIDALDALASNGIVDATLILSAVANGVAKYELLSMPLSEGVMKRLCPIYEAEGLQNAMSKNIDLLRSSDYVWIFTDGMISEGDLDKEYFHARGVKTHAMYVGDPRYKNAMLGSFDYVVCEKDVEDLAKVVFELIK
jgi:hypothetical protein